MSNQSQKTALITGAAHKIGRAIAEHLLDHGYRLILHANTSGQALKQWVSAHPLRSHVIDIVEADLSLESGQKSLMERVSSQLDLLVNNASAFSPKEFQKISRADFQKMQAINLEAPFFITQGLLDNLLKSPNPSVVNIIDAMWQRPLPGFSHYAVSKAGLAILTRTLAVELAPKIRVNAVAPGAISFQPFFSQAEQKEFLARIPKKKLGAFADIASAVLFLHEQALYAAGEILVIDGGRSIA
jgi:pteridine reductase